MLILNKVTTIARHAETVRVREGVDVRENKTLLHMVNVMSVPKSKGFEKRVRLEWRAGGMNQTRGCEVVDTVAFKREIWERGQMRIVYYHCGHIIDFSLIT